MLLAIFLAAAGTAAQSPNFYTDARSASARPAAKKETDKGETPGRPPRTPAPRPPSSTPAVKAPAAGATAKATPASAAGKASSPRPERETPASGKTSPAGSRKPQLNFYADEPVRKKSSPVESRADTTTSVRSSSTTAAGEKARPGREKTVARPVSSAASESSRSQTAGARPAPRRSEPKPVVLLPESLELSKSFPELWDLTSFLITPDRALKYRIESAEKQAQRIEKVLEKLTKAAERREKNVRNAAVAAYLLGQANSSPAGLVPDVTLPHLVAVRSTLQRDAENLQRDWAVFEILRQAENAAAERARTLGRMKSSAGAIAGLPGAEPDPEAVTWSPATIYPRLTQALASERALDPATEQALARAQAISRESWRRPTLASLAPAAPDAPPDDWLAVNEEGSGSAGRAAGTPASRPVPEPRLRTQPRIDRPQETTIVIRTGPDRTVRAAADGTVAFAGPFRGIGHLVVLEHPRGYFSVYENLAGVRVGEGQAVRSGQPLGEATQDRESGEGWMRFQVRRGVDVVPPAELLGNASAASVLTAAR